MKKINLKGLIIVTTLSAVLLTGCSKDKTTNITNNSNYNSNKYTEETYPSEQKAAQSTTTSAKNEQEFSFFSDAKQELSEYIESEDFEKLKEKGKYYVTAGIDFIFFGKEINGITFDKMSTEFKIRIMNDVSVLDGAVEAYFPGYKESLSSKYIVASEFISSKYVDIVDDIREYLGEENWNSLGDMKDQILGDVSDKTEEVIEDIKELYKSWKNN